MTEKFDDQGGFATSDPNRLVRWISSWVMSRMFTIKRVNKRRAVAERARRKQKLPHTIEYFHQVDDPYSYLAAQLLVKMADRYDIELICHLVSQSVGKDVAEPEMLARLSRYDAHQIAPDYGLEFAEHNDALDPEHIKKAQGILAAASGVKRVSAFESVSRALWSSDASELDRLAADLGRASEAEVDATLALGNARRGKLKHYSGAMFYYGGEWYWGVDRLHHLEQRLAELGLDRHDGAPLLAPRQEPNWGGVRSDGSLTMEIYASLRSPYSAVIFDRAVQLAKDSGVTLKMRPVLPMVMRGVPATPIKGLYIFMDAAREARALGVDYGNFSDPIGEPARRCYSLYLWAVTQGKGTELISSFLRHAFALGVDTLADKGLKKVVETAGLDWQVAKGHLGETGWESLLEENRVAMYGAGCWGVPSFRLLDSNGVPIVSLWGQDRLWVVAREIRKQLQGPV
jgi:2-hydroxychromene-2-carboxylate isomerase